MAAMDQEHPAHPAPPLAHRPRSAPRRITVVGAGLAVLTAMLTLPAASQAASPGTAATCQSRPNTPHTDWTGMNFLGDVMCAHNLGSIRVQSTTQSSVNGSIAFSPSWFVCWKKGGAYQGSDIWYYTQGDTVSGSRTAKGWGYLPAAEFGPTQHPVPGLKKCTWAEEKVPTSGRTGLAAGAARS